MGELLLALVPLLQGLLAGPGVTAALSGLTFAQWVTIGIKALAAGPEVMDMLAALHPAFDKFIEDLARTENPQAAAKSVQQWLAANANAAIAIQDLNKD